MPTKSGVSGTTATSFTIAGVSVITVAARRIYDISDQADGIVTSFTVRASSVGAAVPYASGTLELYDGGVLQNFKPAEGLTESSPTTGVFTTGYVPASGTTLVVACFAT